MTDRATFLKYVAHDRVPDWIAAGWTASLALDSCHHGFRAVLMEWLGPGEPVCPDADKQAAP